MEKISVATMSLEDETVDCTKITLSNGNFQNTVVIGERDESWLTRPIFPPDKTLALLAHLTYRDDLHETFFSSDFEQTLLAISTYKKKLLAKLSSSNKTLDRTDFDNYEKNLSESLAKIKNEWQLLTTARNESDGYFGAAFWNSTEQQLVISHRGTKPKEAKALLADVEGVVRNSHTSQINSACTFVEHVLREVSTQKRFKQIQISLTGHSLGAWLAQVTTFSAEYLTIDRETDNFRLKSEEDVAPHAHCVGFESPGCQRMMTKLYEKYHRRYENPDRDFWTTLDITLYLTRPNMVNTCCKHLGKLYQIDIPPFIKNNYMFLNIACYALYVLHYHSMDNIVTAISNNNRVMVIHDWPFVTFPEKIKDDEAKPPKYSIFKLINCLPSLIYDNIAKSGQEVDEFWHRANNDNSYSPEADKNIEWGIRLHYKVRDIATSVCHLNTFSKEEQLFLFCWPNETTLKVNIKNEIKKELPNFKLDKQYFLFENFLYIKNNYKQIECVNFNVEELVNFTKQLFRFINEPVNFAQNLAHITQTNISICKKFSDSYLQQMIIQHLDFKDTIGLEAFLNSNESKKMLLIKTGFKFEIQRIYSILRTSQKEYIFLNLAQLRNLNNYLYLSETITSITDHVLVLDFQQEILNEHDLHLFGLILWKPKTLQTVVVVRSDEAEKTIREVCKNDVEFVERNTHLDFSNLIQESYLWLKSLIENKIRLQGEKINVSKLLGQLETLDSNIVAELIKEDKIFEIGSEPIKLCQSEASYAKRLKFIQTENLFNAFKDNNSIELKSQLFVITSANEVSFEHFFQLLKLKDVNDEQKIKYCTRIFKVENEIIEYNKCKKINILKSGTETHFKNICYHNSEKIVFWLEIINQQFYLHQIFNTDFYIKRQLYFSKYIKENAIFKLSLREKFVINLTDSYDETKIENEQNIFYSNIENEALERFNEWCAESQTTPVHCLKIKGEQLLWQQSYLSLKELRKHLDKDNKQEIDEEALANLNSKVVVVVAEPGMGKSTTLTRLSEFKLGSSWVIRLNLKDHQNERLKLPADYSNTDKAIQNIVAFLMGVSHVNCNLTEILLIYSLTNKISQPVLILFDGYDEINNDFQTELISLMKYLKDKTFANIWITSRKHFARELEDELCVFSTTFKELALHERLNFLKSFWQVRLKLELSQTEYKLAFEDGNNTDLNKFVIFSKALLEKADKVLDEKMSKFMGIPLQMRLLAENFLPEFEEFIKSSGSSEVPQFDEINVTQIYQRFIKIKFDICFKEKSRLSIELNEGFTQWFSDDLIKRHQYIAFQLLFPKEVKLLLAVEPSLSEKDLVIKPNEEIGLKRIGLIYSPRYTGQLEFIHRTFAEYFVSGLILNWLRKPIRSETFEAIESLLKHIFIKLEVICSFLNEQITETDVVSVKPVCFSTSIFNYLSRLRYNNRTNLIEFILSFFANKIWMLEQCKVDGISEDMLDPFLTLTTNHYDVLHKIVLKQSSIIFQVCDIKTEAFEYYMYYRKEETFKIILKALRHHIKMLEEFSKGYQFKDLSDLVQDDEELLRLMEQIMKNEIVRSEESENDDKINGLVNSIRNKYKQNVDDIHDLHKLLNVDKNRERPMVVSQTLSALCYLYNLINEGKPRLIIKDLHHLYCTFNIIKAFAIASIMVKQLKNDALRKETQRDESTERIIRESDEDLFLALTSHCKLSGLNEKLKNESKIFQFLDRLKNDEGFSELIAVLRDYDEKIKVNNDIGPTKPQAPQSVCRRLTIKERFIQIFTKEKHQLAFYDDNAVQMINADRNIPKIFLCFRYFKDHLEPLLRKQLSLEDEINFVFYGFRNERQPILSIFPSSCSKPVQSFLNKIECRATKNLLFSYLLTVTMVDFIVDDDKISTLMNVVVKQLEDKSIESLRDVFNCLKKHSNISHLGLVEEEETVAVFNAEYLRYLLHLLFACDDSVFYQTIKKLQQTFLLEMLNYIPGVPVTGICYLLIFKIFKTKYAELMYADFLEPKIDLIFQYAWTSFLEIAPCLIVLGNEPHMSYAVEHNYTGVISLLFKILKPLPKVLEHFIVTPKDSHKSCLRLALVKSEAETLQHFLLELSRSSVAVKSLIGSFASNEKDKLDLFEEAEINNPGNLLIFLNALEADKLFKIFLLPADESVKPAFYLAGERGCKEVIDTLLNALKSEPDIFWELLTWTDPHSGQTVLHRACDRGYTEVARALLDYLRKHNYTNAILSFFSLKDNLGYTALDLAVLSKRQIIKSNFDYKSQCDIIKTIDYQTLQGSFENFNFINEQPECLQTLSSSLKYLPMSVNLLLIFSKSFINVELMLAIFENEDLKPVLEEMHITLNTYSYRLFHCAIARSSLDLVNELITKGIDVNATNGYGVTPLLRAVRKNELEIAKLLLNNGADAFFRDMNGKSAISIAADIKANRDMIKLFPNQS